MSPFNCSEMHLTFKTQTEVKTDGLVLVRRTFSSQQLCGMLATIRDPMSFENTCYDGGDDHRKELVTEKPGGELCECHVSNHIFLFVFTFVHFVTKLPPKLAIYVSKHSAPSGLVC